ncbi:MAG TPA: MarR family transcriptional regulator [Acidimicrobiales bacterium]|nr:MarR family transcriptional regulator [Acidimicrobiales bacterium]
MEGKHGRTRRPVEDAEAARLLLAFARMGKGARRQGVLPSHIEHLVQSGELAKRHLTAFAIIAVDGPLAVSDLARREGLAVSTASLLVTQLAEAGLVERHEDETDRRRTVVSVAPAHRAESEEVLATALAPLRRALDRIGPERVAVLLQSLEVVAEEMAREDEPVYEVQP